MPADAEIVVIPIDAIYTPIKDVKYEIENSKRKEEETDYERFGFRHRGRWFLSIPRMR